MDLDTSKGHPDMDYDAHKQTYAGFWLGCQVVTVCVVVLLIFMAATLV
ncbi:MAG: aa3-type cytochrome c oxidase subunit IV [Pseudomonadota bacterium]